MEFYEDEIVALYQEIKEALNSRLYGQGYQYVHEEHNDPAFGSRYIIWSNNEEAVRFVWDGKECWFRLEVTRVLPLSALTPWEEIIIKPIDPKMEVSVYRDAVLDEVVKSLS